MNSPDWKTVLAASSDPERANHHFWLLADALPAGRLDALSAESARILAEVLAGSRWLSALLGQRPEWMSLFEDVDALRHPLRKERLRREVAPAVAGAIEKGEFQSAVDVLHEVRLRELLRIGIRDLARLGSLPEVLMELSNAADVFLDGVLQVVWKQQTERFGEPWHLDADGRWQRTAFAVLGLGKLGGQELNYSSDVDLMFLYTEEGGTFRTPPRQKQSGNPVLQNHQFFKRIGEALIREASIRGVDAGGLRIDMRLRPEGKAGPLARSLASYENFYAEWGQSWERMMLLKARGVAGDEALAGEFLELVQPFRYPRSIGEGLLREMSEMKARIEREVVRAGELHRNVKLGRGGIREIEFTVQVLQVLHGGRNPFLQSNQTLTALEKLSGYTVLPSADATALAAAYRFLRDVEHRLQMDEYQQTHTLPEDSSALERLARQMGLGSRDDFAERLRRHTERVRGAYEMVLGKPTEQPGAQVLPAGFSDADSEAWRDLLGKRGFRDPEKGVRLFRVLVEGAGIGHVSSRTADLGRQLAERLLDFCPRIDGDAPGEDPNPDDFVLSDPDRVIARLDSYISAYGARASLYELWTARPNVFAHIVKLFDRSEFLAELAIREPDLVDELEAGAHLGRQKDAQQTLSDLRHGLKDEDQHLWLRRYFQTEFMRLGLRDILGMVGFEQANAELSALAEACVQYAVEVVTRRHRLRQAPFAVIGLGKFGGRELVYGSDLDLVFVAPDRASDVPGLQKMAGEIMDLLSARTQQGSVFLLDARLRPDGEKGLLVNLLRAYEDYYRGRAMLWEIQALTRARWVAGHAPTGKAFEELARKLTNFRTPSQPLAAFQPDWKQTIASMRTRIERERTPKGLDHLAFKTGAGGLIDAEFLAQTMAMENGWFEPNTVRSLERARDLKVLPEDDATELIENFRQLRRMESVLRRWSFEGEVVLPEEPAAQHRVAVRCGYREFRGFLADVGRWRAGIRKVYTEFFRRG